MPRKTNSADNSAARDFLGKIFAELNARGEMEP